VTWNGGKFVAADTNVLPFGTKIVVPGYNGSRPVPVADRGGAIQGRKLDLFFPSHSEALKWGRQTLTVTVLD
jgi:3D (Asp-Asp-Asp) domain-containing protein